MARIAIWLDDIRLPPNSSWVHHKSAKKVIELLKDDGIAAISFDHDLGSKLNGYDVAKVIEELAQQGIITDPIRWEIHSANPIGRDNIIAAMTSAERYWKK